MKIIEHIIAHLFPHKKEDYEENFNDFYCPPSHVLIHWEKDEHLVILKGEKYFYEIDWKTTDKLDKKFDDLNFTLCKNELIASIQNLEARVLNDWPLYRIKSIKTLLGSALAHCLSLDEENARKLIAEAKDMLEVFRKDIIRYWTLLYSLSSLFTFVVIGLTWTAFANKINCCYSANNLPYVLAITFGVVGAFFSICLRIGNVDYSNKTGKDVVKLETICRILVGGISGLIITLMVKAGVILPKLTDNQSVLIVSLLLAFVSGSSERLVPSIITRWSKTYSNKGLDDGH